MHAPLISIIMPAFNASLTIGEAIESVMQQTYQNWELLIIDDGSRDHTVQVANTFQDTRIQTIQEGNHGVSASRNLGIQYSRGEFIAFLDADDIWLPPKLSAQIQQFLYGSKDLGLVHSNYREFDDRGDYSPKPAKYMSQEHFSGMVYHSLIIHDFLATSTVMIKKEVLKGAGVFDINLSGAVDWDLWIRISRDYAFGYLSQPLCRYRLNPKGISKNYRIYEKEVCKVIQRHLLNSDLAAKDISQGKWLHYKHMAHGYARNNEFLSAWKRLFKAVQAKPLEWKNSLTLGYIILHLIKSYFRRLRFVR